MLHTAAYPPLSVRPRPQRNLLGWALPSDEPMEGYYPEIRGEPLTPRERYVLAQLAAGKLDRKTAPDRTGTKSDGLRR